jgi:hypothetical protein
MPTAPDGWKQMQKHKYTKGFTEAARIKDSMSQVNISFSTKPFIV